MQQTDAIMLTETSSYYQQLGTKADLVAGP